MGSEEVKDSMKEMDWKSIGGGADQQSDTKTVTQKRLPKKMRQIPDYYFLPRRSIPSAIAFYGSFIAAGIGAGMLLEVWIEKKVKGNDIAKYATSSFFPSSTAENANPFLQLCISIAVFNCRSCLRILISTELSFVPMTLIGKM
ncbi:hypothetical protein Droror1_Dr00004847 [Drosera rotundifolia]